MDGYGAPFYYDYQNAVTSMISPNTVHCKNTGLSNYFARYLLQKAMSVFEFHFPETWAENYLLYVLYCWGRFAIFNTDRFGVVALDCGLTGYSLFYQPTHAVITNPLIRNTITPKIDSQCVVVKIADTEEVNFWQSIKTPGSINVTPAYTDSTSGDVVKGKAVNKPILATLFDEEAAGYTVVNQWTQNTPMNAAGGYYNTYWHFTDRYWNDFTENHVVFVLD